jgi:uroporphyrinogen III methyltransferase/synthase
LSEQFDWFDKLPLKGLRVLVTRPRDSAGTLASRLSALGAEAVSYPCIETIAIEDCAVAEAAIMSISQYKWLVLTSPRGVKALSGLLEKLKKDARALAPVKVAAIGAATASALASLGISADYVPTNFDAEHLASGLCDIVSKDEKILILRAKEGTPELCAVLDGAGLRYDDIAVYETYYRGEKSAKVAKLLQNGELDYVCFTSASTVRGFTGSLDGTDFSAVNAVCIGKSTAAEAGKHGMRTLISKNATIDDMIDIIISDRGTQR